MGPVHSLLSELGQVLSGQPSGEASFWLPKQVSTLAEGTDFTYQFILYISYFFFFLIVILMVAFLIKYRRRPGVTQPPSSEHNLALELSWTIVPSILVVAIFVLGFRGYLDSKTPPAGAYQIQVTARKWSWAFTYPNGYTDPELHVPVNKPVTLLIRSEDVLHSLFIPAFRTKMDAVPGRYTHLWFEAKFPGTFDIFCTEYCGTQHSGMLSKVHVKSETEFQQWLESVGDQYKGKTPVQVGEIAFNKLGCTACHSTDGSGLEAGKVGPTLKGLFGKTHKVTTDGKERDVTVDEDMLRKSILTPLADIYVGFPPAMPPFQGRVKEEELAGLIEYIKSFK